MDLKQENGRLFALLYNGKKSVNHFVEVKVLVDAENEALIFWPLAHQFLCVPCFPGAASIRRDRRDLHLSDLFVYPLHHLDCGKITHRATIAKVPNLLADELRGVQYCGTGLKDMK